MLGDFTTDEWRLLVGLRDSIFAPEADGRGLMQRLASLPGHDPVLEQLRAILDRTNFAVKSLLDMLARLEPIPTYEQLEQLEICLGVARA